MFSELFVFSVSDHSQPPYNSCTSFLNILRGDCHSGHCCLLRMVGLDGPEKPEEAVLGTDSAFLILVQLGA